MTFHTSPNLKRKCCSLTIKGAIDYLVIFKSGTIAQFSALNWLDISSRFFFPNSSLKLSRELIELYFWCIFFSKIIPKNCQENWLNFTFDAFRLKKNELYSIWLLLYSMGPIHVYWLVWIEKVTLQVVVCHQQFYIFHNIILETFLWKNVLIVKVYVKMVRRYTIFWHNFSTRQVHE